MLPHRCPNCGRFVANSIATINGLGDICLVTADCSRCGEVKVENYEYDDFAFVDYDGVTLEVKGWVGTDD